MGKKVSRTVRGEAQVTCGTKENGKPANFVMGDVADEIAWGRIDRIRRMWEAIEARERVWDDCTLDIGRQVARGKDIIQVTVPFEGNGWMPGTYGWGDGLEDARSLTNLREQFPFLRIEFASEKTATFAKDMLEHRAKRLKQQADDLNKLGAETVSSATIGQALDAYEERFVKLEYREADGLTDHGGLVLRRLAHIRRVLGDEINTPLNKVDTPWLERWRMIWKGRPNVIAKKKGDAEKPSSVEWAKSVVKTINNFVRWLAKQRDLGWTRPHDYEVTPLRIKLTREEKIQKSSKKVRYTKDEVAKLWLAATPLERVYILLALNFGCGEGEATTLALNSLDLEKGKLVHMRTKTDVIGKWPIWDITKEAIRWYLEKVRPESDHPHLLLSRKGIPLSSKTKKRPNGKGRNRKQTIYNKWLSLTKRVQKDHPEFAGLSFNKLRKTGSNPIRKKFDDVVADLYLCHGEETDLDAYTDKPWGRVAQATRWLGRCLDKIFTSVETPFPDRSRAPNNVLSPGKIRRMQELRRQGHTLKHISKTEEVCLQTVCRHCKASSEKQTREPDGTTPS